MHAARDCEKERKEGASKRDLKLRPTLGLRYVLEDLLEGLRRNRRPDATRKVPAGYSLDARATREGGTKHLDWNSFLFLSRF